MDTKLKKKNRFAKDLFTKKYKPRVIKPKKGGEVLKEKKLKSCANLLNDFDDNSSS